MLSHRTRARSSTGRAREFEVAPEDRLSSHAPLHFDLSVFDLFAAAYGGATVVLVPTCDLRTSPSSSRTFHRRAADLRLVLGAVHLTMLVLRGGAR